MKSYALCLLCLGTAASLPAATWVVDNDTSRPADFRSAQAAHDAAAAGDTLLLVGSRTDYASLNLSKRLNIEGPGYDFILNGIASANTNSATISSIYISAGDPIVQGGGASSSTIKGVVISNIDIRGGVTGVVLDQVQGKNPAGNIIGSVATSEDVNFTEPAPRKNYHVTGLVVRRSSLGGVTTIGGDVSIFNCKLTFGAYARTGSIIAQGGGQDTNLRGARITCSQCVVGGLTDGFGTSSIKLPNTASFTNCIVLGPAGTGPENGQTVSGSVLFNNAANYPGNRTTSDPNAFSEVFVTNNISGAGLADSLYRLNTNPSNPARGAGGGGGDAGMFAGAQPYQLSGIPARPRVTHLSTSGVVSNTVGLSVQAGGEVRP